VECQSSRPSNVPAGPPASSPDRSTKRAAQRCALQIAARPAAPIRWRRIPALRRLSRPQLPPGDRLPVKRPVPADRSFATAPHLREATSPNPCRLGHRGVCQCECVIVLPPRRDPRQGWSPPPAYAPAGFARRRGPATLHCAGQSFTPCKVPAEDAPLRLCVESARSRNRPITRRKRSHGTAGPCGAVAPRPLGLSFLSAVTPSAGASTLAHVNQQHLQEPPVRIPPRLPPAGGEKPLTSSSPAVFRRSHVVAKRHGLLLDLRRHCPLTP